MCGVNLSLYFNLFIIFHMIADYKLSFLFWVPCRGNLSHEAFLRNARNSEETLRKEAIERTDLSHLKDTSRLISVDTTPGTVYQVESTGAVVSLNSAVGLIHFYCSQLPSDRFFFRQSNVYARTSKICCCILLIFP